MSITFYIPFDEQIHDASEYIFVIFIMCLEKGVYSVGISAAMIQFIISDVHAVLSKEK